MVNRAKLNCQPEAGRNLEREKGFEPSTLALAVGKARLYP